MRPILSQYDCLCSAILSIEGIRYCAVSDASGNVLAGRQKAGVPPIETDSEREDSSFRVAMISGIIQLMPHSFGRAKALSIDFERVRMLIFPLDQQNFLVATLEPNASVEMTDRVERIITESEDPKTTVG